MNKLPKARNENIVVQNLADEVLIYDMMTDKAYCLNETSANVFNHCDGETSFDELKNKYKYTDEIIFLALDELKEKDLLDSSANYQTPFAGMNRREVIRKVGLATMVALPLISGLVAPTAANAASGTQQVCVTAGQNVCANCNNKSVTFTSFPANSGCTGMSIGNGFVNCGLNNNNRSLASDSRITNCA